MKAFVQRFKRRGSDDELAQDATNSGSHRFASTISNISDRQVHANPSILSNASNRLVHGYGYPTSSSVQHHGSTAHNSYYSPSTHRFIEPPSWAPPPQNPAADGHYYYDAPAPSAAPYDSQAARSSEQQISALSYSYDGAPARSAGEVQGKSAASLPERTAADPVYAGDFMRPKISCLFLELEKLARAGCISNVNKAIITFSLAQDELDAKQKYFADESWKESDEYQQASKGLKKTLDKRMKAELRMASERWKNAYDDLQALWWLNREGELLGYGLLDATTRKSLALLLPTAYIKLLSLGYVL